MTQQTKKFTKREKVKISQSILRKLAKDRNRFKSDAQHIRAVGINFRSYISVMDYGMARTDVKAKVETYLKQVA